MHSREMVASQLSIMAKMSGLQERLVGQYTTPFSTLIVFAQLMTCLITIILAYGIWRAIYNVYFHPLRHFPGPPLAAVSDFFKLWILSTRQNHTLSITAHAKYGPILRAAPNLLSVNDPHMLPLIYHRYVDKTDVYTAGLLGETTPPFQTLGWQEHARKRKMIAPSFSLSNLMKLEGQVDERVIEWTNAIGDRFADSKSCNIFDFAAWSQWYAYDTICQLSFGEPLGFVREGRDIANLIHNFHAMAPFAAVVGALPWLCAPFLQSALTKRFFMPKPGDGSGTGKIMAFRDALLKERLENPKQHQKGDFLDNILAAKHEDGTPISLEAVKTECLVLMVAGSDTSAALLCGFLRYTIEQPEIYAKLIAEIDDFDRRGLLSSPVPTLEEIKKLRYFVACFKEAVRFQPSAPILYPRYVGKDGLNLNGKWVPPGTEIGANPYVIHRDTGVFGEDAAKFNPDRWLDPAKDKEMDKYILGWGYGTRSCLGKNIATLEAYKLMIQFFRLFKPSIVNPDKVWTQKNLALLVHFDMRIRVERRNVTGKCNP
ncbi:cytochrome P450 monooxygenase [Nemania abortiva]|nr:cytochrome P450 monooxygenase [Nemania abortiva]